MAFIDEKCQANDMRGRVLQKHGGSDSLHNFYAPKIISIRSHRQRILSCASVSYIVRQRLDYLSRLCGLNETWTRSIEVKAELVRAGFDSRARVIETGDTADFYSSHYGLGSEFKL